MIRQGIVHDTISDLTHPNLLPSQLPQWSRVNVLDKNRYPKPFLKDRLQPLPLLSGDHVGDFSDTRQTSAESDKGLDYSENMNPQIKIQHLEKNIQFLKTQHNEILRHLHEEIDSLKRENKELQFKIIMMQKQGEIPVQNTAASDVAPKESLKASGSAEASGRAKDPAKVTKTSAKVKSESAKPEDIIQKPEDMKMIFLEEELRELKKSLSDEKKKSAQLQTYLQKLQTTHAHIENELEKTRGSLALAQERERDETFPINPSAPLPFNATFNPLTVHLQAQMPRPPTLKECEIIIKHLQQMSDKQLHELTQLKSDLRDVLYSHKWTPEAYLLAKAYVVSDEAKERADTQSNTRMPLKQPSKKFSLPGLSVFSHNNFLSSFDSPHNHVVPEYSSACYKFDDGGSDFSSDINQSFAGIPWEDRMHCGPQEVACVDLARQMFEDQRPRATYSGAGGCPSGLHPDDREIVRCRLPGLYPSIGNVTTKRMSTIKARNKHKRLLSNCPKLPF